jgi:uncharacterized protein DUF3106
MKLRFQFGGWLLAVASCAGLSLPCYAQRPPLASARQQEHQQQKQNQSKPNRPPANQNRPAGHPPAQRAPFRANGNTGLVRPNPQRGNLAPRQQLGVGAARPWVDKMRDLNPQQRERVMQDSPAFHNLPPEKQNRIRNQFSQWDSKTPQQRADQREREQAWRQMTPDQREHVKNDVLPAWRQMPAERQQAIQQRLSVLKNMPEFARNQRLSDPNFTRGMSEEDKATLHDLSHLHVGGAPDPPNE